MKIPHWPIYVGPEKFDSTSSLKRILLFLEKINNPERKLKNIFHITGTKGKGSIAKYISSIFKYANCTVNSYTSPHIYECNERILLNSNQISDKSLMNLTERIKIIAEKYNIELSSFEALTASMILAFGECSADINVIEVGMGGQFDATNVFDFNPPICTIFTPIHIDHSLYLGNTIEEIAYNKSFLIKNDNKGNINNNIIISSQPKQALEILLAVCKKNNIPDENIYIYDRDFFISKIKNKNDIESKEFMLFESKKFGNFILNKPLLLGDYQMINATSAIMSVLASNLCDILPNAIIQNEMINNTINENIEYNEIISQGIINTKHIVRMEKIDKKEILNFFPIGSIFYIDGAHNQLAAFAMKQFIIDFKQNNQSYKVYLAIARTKGANNENFVSVFKNENYQNENNINNKINLIDKIICTQALESLPEPPENIQKACEKFNINNDIAYNMKEVCQKIQTDCNNLKCLIIATGSLYIARDVKVMN